MPQAGSRSSWEATFSNMRERLLGNQEALLKLFIGASRPRLPGHFRIFAISDIHTDSVENWDWVRSLSELDYQQDAVIVAGDVSHHLHLVKDTLQEFRRKFRHVFFVPGNHDLWCTGAGSESGDSVHKLQELLRTCAQLGVHTAPCRIRSSASEDAVWVVPMLSWYHISFDTEPDLPDLRCPPVTRVMTDFSACRWPKGMSPLGEDVALYMDSLNNLAAGQDLWDHIKASGERIVSFSHFLPRKELCPEKRFLTYANLPKAIGSDVLGRRVNQLQPDVHVFGHTHFGWDQEINGVRYIQAALAYPYERSRRMRSLTIANAPDQLLMVYDSAAAGGFPPPMSASWSDYYKMFPRDPTNTEVAWWVKKRVRRRSSRNR